MACPLCVTATGSRRQSASVTPHLNAAAVSEAHPGCRTGQPSALTAEPSEGMRPLAFGPLCTGVSCVAPARAHCRDPQVGLHAGGRRRGPAPNAAQKKRADSWPRSQGETAQRGDGRGF